MSSMVVLNGNLKKSLNEVTTALMDARCKQRELIDLLKSEKEYYQDLIAAELIYNLTTNNLMFYEDMLVSFENSEHDLQ